MRGVAALAFCPIIMRRRTTSSGKVQVAAETPATEPMHRDTTLGTCEARRLKPALCCSFA